MAAPKGNKFYKLRKDFEGDGRKISEEQLFSKAQEYIDYCLNTPIYQTDFRGKDSNRVEIPKMRAMCLKGLCHWVGISTTTLHEMEKDQKYANIITQVKQLMFTYKFEGAAADQLNHNIIARDLGLQDHQKVNSTNSNFNTDLTKEDVKNISKMLDDEF